MSDTRIEAVAAGGAERGPPRKRRRLVVSCTECHRRKQKCDRDLPCANCRSRNKESACTYETTAKSPDKKKSSPSPASPPSQPPRSSSSRDPEGKNHHHEDGALTSVAAALGYSSTSASTMSFLRRMETQLDDGEDEDGAGLGGGSTAMLRESLTSRDALITKEKFKSLIRQLPAQTFLDKLIAIFMDTFNNQYYSIDPDVFYAQLERWHALPFKVLTSQGPQALSPDLRAFPAVLFQVIATALLVVVEGGEMAAEFEGLKFAASMTFEDLSNDYSEAGVGIVSLIDKKNLTITTVQAEFLRASFLKFTANVTESWHAIAMTIRDAQELGMHRDGLDPEPEDDSAEAALENQWLIQRRRKMYMILVNWDIQMSSFLGRPGVINRGQGLPTLPVDSPKPKDRSRTPVMPRDELRDPPTPLAAGLWLTKLSRPLFDIQDLETESYHPKDYHKIDMIHEKIVEIEETKPAIFRVENPDTRWDGRPDTSWVPYVRNYFAGLHGFSRMVLHRPYIFHREKSRHEALKASLTVLEMGGKMFKDLPQDHWRNYHLFFGTFDAIILMATIYMLFPAEQSELRHVALQQFHWAIERFSAMQERNPLAKAALGVLKAIQVKLIKVINRAIEAPPVSSGGFPSLETPSSSRKAPTSSSWTNSTSPSSSENRGTVGDITGRAGSLTMSSGEEGSTEPSMTFTPGTGTGSMTMPSSTTLANDWSMPAMDLSSLQPMYPTYDLLFNDLNVVNDGTMAGLGDFSFSAMAGDQAQAQPQTQVHAQHGQYQQHGSTPWQFGGDFGDDTVWKLLNEWSPGTIS